MTSLTRRNRELFLAVQSPFQPYGCNVQYEQDTLDRLSDDSDILEAGEDSAASLSDSDSVEYSELGGGSDFVETGGFGFGDGDADVIAASPIDFTPFQSLPFEDMQSNLVMLACLGGGFLACLVGAGFSLKTASRMTGGPWVSVRRASGTALLSLVAFIGSVIALSELAKDLAPIQAIGIAVGVGIGVVALRLRQNPVRAAFTSLVAVGLQAGFMALLATWFGMALPEFASKDQLAVVANHAQPFVDSVAARVCPGDDAAIREKLSLSAVLVPLGNDGTKPERKYSAVKARGLRENPFAD
jgi:hypothetical protein